MTINGNTYRQIQESEHALLCEGTTPGGATFYEVWKKRYTKKDYTHKSGKMIPANSLIKPSNEDFGTYAWSFFTKDKAIAKFTSIGVPNSHYLGQGVVLVIEKNNGLKTI